MLAARTLTPSNTTPPQKKEKKETSSGCRSRIASSGSTWFPLTSEAQAKEGRPSGGTRQQDSKGGSFTSIVSFSYLVPYVLVRAGEDDASHWGWSREWRHPPHLHLPCGRAANRSPSHVEDGCHAPYLCCDPKHLWCASRGVSSLTNAGGCCCASLAPCLPRGSLWLFEAWMQHEYLLPAAE